MSIFSRNKGPQDVEYTRQEFLQIIQRLPWYQRLKNEVGSAKAQLTANIVFDKQVQSSNMGGTKVKVRALQIPTYSSTIDMIFQFECNQIQGKKIYVASLLGQARNGSLYAKLQAATEAEANYTTITGTPADGTQLGDVRKAYDWVGRSWQGGGKQAILGALTHHVLIAPAGQALGLTPAILDDIYGRVVQNPPPFRAPNYMCSYPSSIGGRHLLERIFQLTSNIAWPAQGDRKWYDFALFYMAAVVTVQGYTDGNKRTGRMAYSVMLLKGGVPFIAPNVALENQLHAMNG